MCVAPAKCMPRRWVGGFACERVITREYYRYGVVVWLHLVFPCAGGTAGRLLPTVWRETWQRMQWQTARARCSLLGPASRASCVVFRFRPRRLAFRCPWRARRCITHHIGLFACVHARVDPLASPSGQYSHDSRPCYLQAAP